MTGMHNKEWKFEVKTSYSWSRIMKIQKIRMKLIGPGLTLLWELI